MAFMMDKTKLLIQVLFEPTFSVIFYIFQITNNRIFSFSFLYSFFFSFSFFLLFNMEQAISTEANSTQESLTCRWRDCNKIFPTHSTLANHLSEDHVGWKKGGYFCEWSNCARRGAKCHNRFALMMHLRIHTGEKPFECNYPDCGQT